MRANVPGEGVGMAGRYLHRRRVGIIEATGMGNRYRNMYLPFVENDAYAPAWYPRSDFVFPCFSSRIEPACRNPGRPA